MICKEIKPLRQKLEHKSQGKVSSLHSRVEHRRRHFLHLLILAVAFSSMLVGISGGAGAVAHTLRSTPESDLRSVEHLQSHTSPARDAHRQRHVYSRRGPAPEYRRNGNANAKPHKYGARQHGARGRSHSPVLHLHSAAGQYLDRNRQRLRHRFGVPGMEQP